MAHIIAQIVYNDSVDEKTCIRVLSAFLPKDTIRVSSGVVTRNLDEDMDIFYDLPAGYLRLNIHPSSLPCLLLVDKQHLQPLREFVREFNTTMLD